MKHIRNFCIIAHIDHGKSTLADRILESTHTIAPREMQEQVLDQMDLERERGITIKSHPVAITYDTGSETYRLNLIDTPGHVDFSYEVSRSLTACEGALLLVDATQGVEAQTLANYFLALENGLTIIPVINKIDMPMAEIERTKAEIEKVLGMPAADAILISAKTGTGVDSVMHAIVERIPPPQGSSGAPLKALIFDSHYDSYRGVVPFVRVFAGTLSKGVKIKTMSNEMEFEVAEVGIFTPEMLPVDSLAAGEVGYIMAGIKNIEDTKVGDTITYAQNSALEPLPGYRPIKPMVYCGIYPVDTLDYENLRESLLKLRLNDAALVFEPETSIALGFGFRCGFLGLLHMEIVQERLEREYGLNLIATAPSVVYHILKTNGDILEIDNPEHFPDPTHIDAIEEPMIKATLMTPSDYIGGIMDLAQNHRGTFINMEYLGENRCIIHYAFPLSEIITNFFDQLKSRTRGYASFDYEFTGYKEADLVKLDIMVNRQRVDALSIIVHKDNAYNYSRKLVDKLKAVIPRQLFEVPIQAAIGGKIIARETISAMRKNVLAKCYGGDITRKRKLLEKQKEGKKRMKQIGNVDIPQDAFLAVLKVDTEE